MTSSLSYIPYILVALGSALGGLLRFALGRVALALDTSLPWSTILINVAGSFAIGFFGTLTLPGSRYEASENVRLFVMVGLCGGFTTFSAFSLQTFDLARGGSMVRALLNVALSVGLCLAAIAMGHHLAQRGTAAYAVAQTSDEEFSS